MALRSGYKGYKKLAEGLKEFWPGILGADIPALKKTFLDWSSYAVTGVHNLAKSYKAETYTEQYYRALNIDMNLQPSTTYNFILDLPNSGNEYYFNDSLFEGGDTITADGTKKVVKRTTKSTLDNSQYNLANGGWYILKNSKAQSSAPAFTGIAVCYEADTSDEITPYAMTNQEITELLTFEQYENLTVKSENVTGAHVSFTRMGKIGIINGYFTLSADTPSNTQLFELPTILPDWSGINGNYRPFMYSVGYEDATVECGIKWINHNIQTDGACKAGTYGLNMVSFLH